MTTSLFNLWISKMALTMRCRRQLRMRPGCLGEGGMGPPLESKLTRAQELNVPGNRRGQRGHDVSRQVMTPVGMI